MAKVKGPSRKMKDEELNITSMMDMMTIILVFLLKSYSTQDISIAGDVDLELPSSTSLKEPELAVNVVVTRSRIVVDGVELPTSGGRSPLRLERIEDEDRPGREIIAIPEEEKRGQLIASLFERLERKATDSKAMGESTGNDEHDFKGRVLLQCDKKLPFSVIREVMYTAGQAQFGEFKFVVYKTE